VFPFSSTLTPIFNFLYTACSTPPPIFITFDNSASPLFSWYYSSFSHNAGKVGGRGNLVYLLLFFVVFFHHSLLFSLYSFISLGCLLWNLLSFFSFCSFIWIFECVSITCLMSFSFLILFFVCCISVSLFHYLPCLLIFFVLFVIPQFFNSLGTCLFLPSYYFLHVLFSRILLSSLFSVNSSICLILSVVLCHL